MKCPLGEFHDAIYCQEYKKIDSNAEACELHNKIVKAIGSELTAKFHTRLETLHETHDSEHMRFYPVEGRDAQSFTPKCRIMIRTYTERLK